MMLVHTRSEGKLPRSTLVHKKAMAIPGEVFGRSGLRRRSAHESWIGFLRIDHARTAYFGSERALVASWPIRSQSLHVSGQSFCSSIVTRGLTADSSLSMDRC